MKIIIESVPHAEQRYDTVGDWTIDEDGTWRIKVSEFGPRGWWQGQFLVALHELVEMALCTNLGVTPAEVDRFDFSYADPAVEPGDDPNAPYYSAHQLACGVERQMAAFLDVTWTEYERMLEELHQ